MGIRRRKHVVIIGILSLLGLMVCSFTSSNLMIVIKSGECVSGSKRGMQPPLIGVAVDDDHVLSREPHSRLVKTVPGEEPFGAKSHDTCRCPAGLVNQKRSRQREVTTKRTDKIHVVIVTNRRSGSSFLGQFFNQNPKVFFQFEPLKLTEWKREFYPDRIQYLRRLLKCQFLRTPYLDEFYNREPLHRRSSQVLVEPPLCNITLRYHRPLTDNAMRYCPPLETTPLMQACQKKQHQAVKLIRLYNISSLEEMACDPDINLKVLHLVRDPRATHHSKSRIRRANVSLELGKSLDADISYLCKRINRNLDFAGSMPAWLRGRYKLIRYEDIAYEPRELAREIYEFVGLGRLPQKVLKWIQDNTQRNVQPSFKSHDTPYILTKNASQVPEAWRHHVPIQVVLRMQEFCGETLRRLGYKEVKSKQELLDNSNSLVVDLPTS
ncbi:carbohydrate sulfotransferase 1-like [Acanthaster planci]|uniref:Carbohydrate sulfotransferase 1-like n=1 Tax=Acanthaster planci TaxID=133434 RepID=A0A8B7Y5A8_ACAPL|nr:carbohydrate sulfotransferase 1-like [Acanthaster planci]XP_022087727.1 carbohydrate sulfotransferase 1-like [Acanthaster planci]